MDIIVYKISEMQGNYSGATFYTSMFNFSASGSETLLYTLDNQLLFFGMKIIQKQLNLNSSFDFNLTYPGGNQLTAVLANYQQYL